MQTVITEHDRISEHVETHTPARKWKKVPMVSPQPVVFRHGRPLGSDQKDDLLKWNTLSGTTLRTHAGLYKLYSYKTLREVFSWARYFRAGMVVLYRHPGERLDTDYEMLLVHQKPTRYDSAYGVEEMPIRKGPPKGSAEPHEYSALGTAQRELLEETGIDISNSAIGARLCTATFIHRRPEFNICELSIYFVVVLDCKPDVVISTEELVGYEWVDVKKGLRGIGNITTPTSMLFTALEDVNFWGPMHAVIPRSIL